MWPNVRDLTVILTLLASSALAGCSQDLSQINDTPLPSDSTVDPALHLPWSEITGRIAVHYLTDDNSRRTLLIDGARRQVKFMGDFGTYVGNIALSPDGRQLALEYALGRVYDNFVGVRIVSTSAVSVGRWDLPNTDQRGYYATFRNDGTLTYWSGDTLFAGGAAVTTVSGWKIRPHSWLNDYTRFALTKQTSGTTSSVFSVYMVDVGGTELEFLKGQSSSIWWSPAAAPGGGSLAALRSGNRQFLFNLGQVWIVNADGTDLRLLHAAAVKSPSWSPDGTQLVVAGGQQDCMCDSEDPGVYLLRLDGSFRKLMSVNAQLVAWSR